KVQILVFCLCLFLTVTAILAAVIDVDTVLTKVNKPFVKSIQSADGDIIDCVDIYKQPAFDHPLLVNHTLQLEPTSYPEEVLRNDIGRGEEIMTQIWHRNGSCPEGTIPIRRRRRREEITMRGKKRPFTVHMDAVNQQFINHEHAIGYVNQGPYYGARGTFNVWKPNTQIDTEFSVSQLWIVAGDSQPETETVEAGWQVYPDYYKSSKEPIFFVFWTRDYYQSTGCYNLDCPGFVQVSKRISLGSAIAPVSQYNDKQYEITILIWEDRETKNWWLHSFGEVIGYWPASLFKALPEKGSRLVEWGGEVLDLRIGGQHTTTEMGSGHWPEEGFHKAAYVSDLRIVDQTTKLYPAKGVRTLAADRNCYSANLVRGNWLYYGGPGRNPNC
ncbi:hypothetical protein M569_06912, partial [Genlisea aurea]